MKICVLADSEWQGYDPSPYLEGYDWEIQWIQKATADPQISALAQKGHAVFLNLCDGGVGEESAGIEAVYALERLNVPFTGAVSDFYDPTREMMKRACHAAGIKTPPALFAADANDIERAAECLRFPLIVKPPQGYSSDGLTKESRVENAAQLRVLAPRAIAEYGRALIEEFVVGREFTALVVENPENPADPLAYVPVEFRFPAGESFKHYALKWENWREMECAVCQDADLARRLQNLSIKLFVGLNGSGYGRCDIRMDAQGELYLLEINPNCGIFFAPAEPGSADYILLNSTEGHRGFLERILRAAFTRQQRRSKQWGWGNALRSRGVGAHA